MPKISNSTVIVSYDISNDDKREEVRKFLVNKLTAKQKTESTYEFNFNEKTKKWEDIINKLSDIINNNDVIYLWDLVKNSETNEIELHRNKI